MPVGGASITEPEDGRTVQQMYDAGQLPQLVDPVMIAAFEGWNDAGDAATGAVEHLAEVWDSDELARLDPEDYYDFQVNRPTVSLGEDGVRRIEWPTTSMSVASLPAAGRDVVLVRGIEPSMRWRAFTAELLDIAQALGVRTVVVLGALLADSPHSRPVPVTGTATDPAVAAELGLELSRYEGPTGIVGVVQDACGAVGLRAISVWAAVPHYVAAPPCPKATMALLNRVEDILGIAIPLGELPEAARAWEAGVDELAAEDSDVAEYVHSLEQAKDAAELPEASGEAIAREFERDLRRRGDEPPPRG